MVDFGLRNLDRVIASIGEPDRDSREALTGALAAVGLCNIRPHADLDHLLRAASDADILILSDTLAPELWKTIRAIRHQRYDLNPFVAIICVISGEDHTAAQEAIAAGADDVIARPLHQEQFLQRLRRVMAQRAPFVISSDYIGPERRARDRGPSIARIVVPNSIVAASGGRGGGPGGIPAMIALAMRDVVQARLDAHGHRLGWLAHLADNETFPNAAAVLKDAADLAGSLGEPALNLLCATLAARVDATVVTAPARDLWDLIGGASGCLRLGISAEMAAADAIHGAAAFRQRPRMSLAPIEGIGIARRADSAAFPIIEIRKVSQGEILFAQDEPATAGFVIASGCIAFYRQRQERQVPVARLRRGESFGDLLVMDGTPRRVTASADEDSIVCVLRPSEMMTADPDVRNLLGLLLTSLRHTHAVFTPKSRNISDSVQQIDQQVAAITDYLQSPSASPGLKTEAVGIAARLSDLTRELLDLMSTHPALDRRTRALPDAADPSQPS